MVPSILYNRLTYDGTTGGRTMELPYDNSIETPANLRWLINKTIRNAVGDGQLPEADRENHMVLIVPWDADVDSDCSVSRRICTTLREERDLNAFTWADVSDVLDERGANATLGDATRAVAHVSDTVFVICAEETVGPQTRSPHTEAILEDFSREWGTPKHVSERLWLLRWKDEVEVPDQSLPEEWQATQQKVSDDDADRYKDVYGHIVQHTEQSLRDLDGETAGRYWYGD